MINSHLPHAILSLPAALRTQLFTKAAPLATIRTLSTTLHRTHATYNTNASPAPSSVTPSEVTHFTALASSWWDPHGPSRLLHLMNPLRHDFIHRCLRQPSSTSSSPLEAPLPPDHSLRVLDVGCGGGIFAESAARSRLVRSVTAIDPTPNVIGVAKRHQRADPKLLEPGKLEYRNCALEQLPTSQDAGEDGLYDLITVFEVIEHIREPSPFLRACLARLKPGGWLVGSTIARTGVSWFTTKFVAEDVLRMVPRGTHNWEQYIQPGELEGWARKEMDVETGKAGWRVMGVVYVPGLGWKEVGGSEEWGNYFFGMRKTL